MGISRTQALGTSGVYGMLGQSCFALSKSIWLTCFELDLKNIYNNNNNRVSINDVHF